jgi:beta-lactamase regulating signal transducer with metallopeptidase domain
MNAFAHWFTPDVLRALGLSLLHFLWQGAALAALAAAAIALARKASTRYAIAVGALIAMVAAPPFTYSVLRESSPTFAAPVQNSLQGSVPAITRAVNLASHRIVSGAQSSFFASSEILTVFVELWFIGVLLFSLRTAGGFFLVARLRRRDSKPINSELLALCREMQNRLGITRAIRYCESLNLDAPAVIGWLRPVVLLPISALTGLSQHQLRTVIAHELAHIRRLDAFFNLFQVAAETLLFYHPAVWWLSKRIRAERENCCDDVALSVCGNPAEYARALALMEEWRTAPSFVMAANRGPLASRITRLLGITEKGSSLRNAGVAFGVLCLAAALFAGNALFGLVRTTSAYSFGRLQGTASSDSSEPAIVVTAPRPTLQPKPSAKPVPAPAQSDTQEADAHAVSVQIPTALLRQVLTRTYSEVVKDVLYELSSARSNAQDAQPAPKSQSYIDAMKAEGFDHLSADDLISMKIQGITPEYIHAIRAEGLKPSADELVGMKVQGITPDYIHQVRAMKLNPDIDSLIGMKVQGITPQYVDEMRKLGFQPDTDQLIDMKVQGITPEYVEQMRKLGFKPDSDQLIGMKVQGITPEYVHQLNELNIHPDIDDLIGMKVQGINADYVRSIRATGLSPDKDEWIALKVQGVSEDYIKGLQAAGFKPDVDEIIGAKVQGITPQFIELARSHGFKNLDLDKLIQLKHANVLE